MLEFLLESPGFSIDIETMSLSGKKKDNLHFKKMKIRCIAVATDSAGVCFTPEEIQETDDLAIFEEAITNPKYKKVGHNLKFDLKCIYTQFGFRGTTHFDTAIAAKLLDESAEHGLEYTASRYLKIQPYKLDYKEEHTIEEWKKHCLQDAKYTLSLAHLFEQRLKTELLWPIFKTEMEVQNVFTNAEIIGIPVDSEYLVRLLLRYRRHTKRIEKSVFKLLGVEINLDSPRQLADMLYNKFGFKIEKENKTGPSTDAKTLENLSKQENPNPLPRWLLVRKHWEMLARHIEKLAKESIDGRIYPTFNTIGTETGRFSCSDPNLQQIPSKTKESLAIRRGFPGNLCVFDYSNVELRLLAHFTADPKLLAIYRPGGSGDLHTHTAETLGVTRGMAKTINFGISYGMGPKRLAEALEITETKAKEYLEEWYRQYRYVNDWKKMIINTVKKYGFVRSIGGRKRRIAINSLPVREQWKAEREIINFVIQGSSADITKMAIVALKDEDIRLQVHDEIIIHNPKRSLEEIKHIAANVVKLKVPLDIDIALCNNWADMKE